MAPMSVQIPKQSPGFSEACDNFGSDPVGSGFRACGRASARLLATATNSSFGPAQSITAPQNRNSRRFSSRRTAYRVATIRKRPLVAFAISGLQLRSNVGRTPRSARVPLDPLLAPYRNLKTEQLVRKIFDIPFILQHNLSPNRTSCSEMR